jgi:hypothetical protein
MTRVHDHGRGCAAINNSRNEFVVDNIETGFDLHRLDTGHWKRSFPTGKPTRKLPKQVAFGERSKVVVGGSDHGAVYVFDRKTAFPLHVLRHGDALVQTLTVSGL